MTQTTTTKTDIKQRLTAFVDPILVKRVKVRGALEGLTISEVVEKALEAYAPKIEKNADHYVSLRFIDGLAIDSQVTATDAKTKRKVLKHTKALVVSR